MITLAATKQHLRVDHPDDDARIAGFIIAAEAYLGAIGIAMTTPRPAPIDQAVLIVVAHFYDNGTGFEGIGKTVDALIAPYRCPLT